MHSVDHLEKIASYIRYLILASTNKAGSGHPTSSLSAVELMAALMFGNIFRYDVKNPGHPLNDRLIFSKGHASPLFYALWTAAGGITQEEMMTYRSFDSRLEGHPTMRLPYTEAPTGSLGQGLSVGVGMALNAKYLDKLSSCAYVLLGDSEMAEGSQWEALQIAARYKLDNLVGILDVNRLGQRGETMYGHDVWAYRKRIDAFGWRTFLVEDGHAIPAIVRQFRRARKVRGKPVMLIAKTIKGKGVSFLENKDGWHGKVLNTQDTELAIKELGDIDETVRGYVIKPNPLSDGDKKHIVDVDKNTEERNVLAMSSVPYAKDALIATRKAYGNALVRLFPQFPQMVALDAEVSNSTYAEFFKEAHPDRFFEMFIAEQNMAGTALGLARRGKLPFVSTFAAFFTRAFDQIRMSQYADAHIVFAGSHAGVSIGEDGASQMGLEDIAMFRSILSSTVLYPSDAVATEKLMEQAALHKGIIYIRTTRKDTSVLYAPDEQFLIGGSKAIRHSADDKATVVAAGITLHEALSAYDELKKEGILIRVIDCYSIKPLDDQAIRSAAKETKIVITVEDHYPDGGIGEATAFSLAGMPVSFRSLAVRNAPRSGTPGELLEYEGISRDAIVKAVKELV